jgi:hypothetical protein
MISSNGNTGYEIRHLPVVGQQIKDLAKKAATRGQKATFLAALTTVLTKLRMEPSQWGDPEYNLHTPGGCVYHGVLDPVIAKYAVFEHEKNRIADKHTIVAK